MESSESNSRKRGIDQQIKDVAKRARIMPEGTFSIHKIIYYLILKISCGQNNVHRIGKLHVP